MAECYNRIGSKARGTRAQFRLNTQGLLPFKCSYPVHLTDVMDIAQSSQSGLLKDAEPNKGTRTRTVREYEQTISELKKENFDLKLRIFLLEEAINKNCRKDGTTQDKSKNVEVIIELQVETESLRKELSCKTKSLEEALEEIEKLQQEYSQLQEQLTEVAELPSKEQLILLQDEKSILQKEIENLQTSLIEKNKELEEASHQIEELSSNNIYLEEKVKKSSIAIRGFISKHAKELELIPQAIRPIVQSAVESAKNNDYHNLDAAVKSLKASLCEMATVPLKEYVNDSEDKENKDENSENMCLSEETFKSGETVRQLQKYQSDPYIQLSNLQEFKDFTTEIGAKTKQCSRSLELVHQEYTARENMLNNSAMSSARSFSIQQQENISSLTSPQIGREIGVTTLEPFHHSHPNSKRAVKTNNSATSSARSFFTQQQENSSSLTSPQIGMEKAVTTLEPFHHSHPNSKRGVKINNSAMPFSRSISTQQLENTSLTSPQIGTERAVTNFEVFNSSYHSHPNSTSAVKITNVSDSQQSLANENFSLNNSCNISEGTSILKENEYLKSEVRLKSVVIEELNSICHEAEMKQLCLQEELKGAVSKIKQLEITISDGDKKVMSIVKSVSTQTSPLEDQLMQFKESYKSIVDAALSNNVDELKEEVLMLLLTIEEKEKEISELKQIMENLEVELENAVNNKEIESDEDMNEKNDLHERLALSCSVNKELMKHLHSLEAFMEDLLHHRNLDRSSIENLSDNSDFLLQLSKRLDESLKLSQVLSDHLSICEGSKVFGSEVSVSKDDINMSDTKSYQHFDVSKWNLSKSDSVDEGRRKFMSSNQASFSKFAGTGKRWSYSSQHKSNLLEKSDNVVVLGTSNNEDLILLLNENGDPADVLIRNSNTGAADCKVETHPMLQHDDQHRRRCWMNESVAGFKRNGVACTYHTQNLNDMQMKALGQSHPWYGSYMSSDSDIWSEPDRDISMQRIGIDIKNSPVSTKSPRKLRFKDKRTTDELSSEKNSSSFGAYKTQSWSRRRRSSGSTSKRLFLKEAASKTDYKLEKYIPLLNEKIKKITVVSNQLEKIKNMETEEAEIICDITDELNGVLASVNETCDKLVLIKESSKKGTPYVCEKCSIVELLLDLERTRKRIHASGLLENIKETKIEHLTQMLLSEVDDLKQQLEEPHAILSSGAENSVSNLSDKGSEIDKLHFYENIESKGVKDYVNKMNDKYNCIDQELKAMQIKYEALNKDFDNINTKYNSKEQTLSDMKNECQVHCKELENSKKEKRLLEKDLEDIQSENENLKLEFIRIENEKKLLEKQLQLQKDQVKFFENQVQSNKDEYLLTVEEKGKILNSRENVEKEKEELQIQNKLLLNQLKELNEKYDDIFKQLKESESKKESLKKDLASESDERAKEQLEQSDSKHDSMHINKEFSKDKFVEKESKLSEENESLRISLRDVENNKEMLDRELKNISDELNFVKKQVLESNDKYMCLEKSKKELEDKNRLVEEQLEEIKNKYQLIKKELQNREDQKTMLECELKKIKEIKLAIEKEKEDLKKEVELKEKQLEDVKSINQSQEEKYSKIKCKIELYEKELVDMQAKNSLTEQEKVLAYEKIETLEKEKKCLEAEMLQELKDVKGSKKSVEKELEMYKNENADLTKDLDKTREILNNERNVINDLKLENCKLKNDVDNLQQEKSNLNQEKQNIAAENSNNILKLNEVNKKNNNLKNLISNLEQRTSETDELCAQLQAELHNTKEQLMKLDLKCSEYETQLTLESKNKKEYLSKLKILESNLFDEKKQIVELTSEKDDLLKHFEAQTDKLVILEKERSDLAEQLQEKEKELSTLHKIHKELKSEHSALLKEKKALEEKLISLTASYNELQEDLKAKGDHVQKLESRCANYKNEMLSSSAIADNFIEKLKTIKKEISSNTQLTNKIFGFNMTETISERKNDSLDDLSLSKDKRIDKLCSNIIMEHCNYFKRLANNVQFLKKNSLTLEGSKAKEEQLKLELGSLQSRLEFLKIELDNVNKQKDEMKNVIDEHIKIISSKEKMLSLKDSEIHSLRLQLIGIKNETDKEKQQLKQLNIQEMEKDQLKKLGEHLQCIINELRKMLLDKEKLLANCDAEINSLKAQLIAFQKKVEKSDSQLNAKDDEITCLQERIFNLQTQMNNLLAEKIDFNKQSNNKEKKFFTDTETSTTNLLDFSRLHSYVSDKQTQKDFDNSSDISAEYSKYDIHSEESLTSPKSQVKELVKKINSLQIKLSISSKRIEILEQEKNDLRENLLAEVHARKKASLPTLENTNEKIIELEAQLEKKVSFIKELKNELYKTCDSLVKKQEEVDDLRQKISLMENLKSEIQFYKDFSSNSLSIEANISSLRKHKWELIQTIFDMQKKLYEKKGIHLNHFENFQKHIENLHSLQISSKLSKSESEPILSSNAAASSKNVSLNRQKFLNCVLVGLEIDIECLENLKIFLKRFFVPFILQSDETADQNAVKSDDAIFVTKSSLESSPSLNYVVKRRNKKISESCTNCPDLVMMESKKVEKCDTLPNLYDEWSKMAWTLSRKLDHVENIIKSLDSEYLYMKKLEFTSEGKSSCVPVESLLQKIFHEIKTLLQSTKIFHLNASLKSSGSFSETVVRISSKQDLSDHESLLSEETITLSRSGSLSPVSFEENLVVKIHPIDTVTSDKDKACDKTNSKEVIDETYTSKLQTAGSSQDSVCQRSHYSSPDLGIESDPNHDSSAPEQMERHELCKDVKVSSTEIKIRPKLVGRQPKKSMYTNTETSRKNSDVEAAFVRGDTLHAIGILQEYELLKREVQESLVGIKSVLSRTGDGLHQIAKNTSPRKILEYSTFRAIKDTCANIEVCLKEAYKLVNNFWIAPCPTSEEWNLLIQQNQEKCDKILMLKNSMQKQEEDFKVAMNKLQQAQLVKEQMEKKISKKLVKTKKILRRAEFKLLESECHNLVPLPNFPSESSHCQENH